MRKIKETISSCLCSSSEHMITIGMGVIFILSGIYDLSSSPENINFGRLFGFIARMLGYKIAITLEFIAGISLIIIGLNHKRRK